MQKQKIFRALENNKAASFYMKGDSRLYTVCMDNGFVKITTENSDPYFCTFGVLPLFLDEIPCHLLSESEVTNIREWDKICKFIRSIPEFHKMKLIKPSKADAIVGSPIGEKWHGENLVSDNDFLSITSIERHLDFCTYGIIEYSYGGINYYNEYNTFEEFKEVLGTFVEETKLFEESEDMNLFK